MENFKPLLAIFWGVENYKGAFENISESRETLKGLDGNYLAKRKGIDSFDWEIGGNL